jgi:SAM-dependent methyltransferase
MEFTGERVIPGQTDPDLMNEHRARYRFAEALVSSKAVLDAGCGVGYGSAQLAPTAARVVGLDFAHDAVLAGRREYAHPRVHFVQGDCGRLPFPDRSFDVVVAFEVIEHLENWRDLLSEAGRVLAPDGQFIVSTPNRLYYGESRAEPNPFHAHEFEYEEFVEALRQVFPHTTIFLENHTDAITFTPLEVQGVRTRLENDVPQPQEAHFFLAVCSHRPLHGSPAFVYVPSAGNVLRERERHIQLLQEELRQKERWLEETTLELKKLSEENLAQQERAQAAVNKLEAELQEKIQWAERVKAELAATQGELTKCVELLTRAEATVVERSEWAKRLDRELTAIYASKGYRISRRLGLSPAPPAAPADAVQGSGKDGNST